MAENNAMVYGLLFHQIEQIEIGDPNDYDDQDDAYGQLDQIEVYGIYTTYDKAQAALDAYQKQYPYASETPEIRGFALNRPVQ